MKNTLFLESFTDFESFAEWVSLALFTILFGGLCFLTVKVMTTDYPILHHYVHAIIVVILFAFMCLTATGIILIIITKKARLNQ